MCDLTSDTSVPLTEPFAVISVRKLLFVSGWVICDLVWLTSDEFTTRLAFVSPTKTLMFTGALGSVCPNLSVTLLNVTVIVWALPIPVRLTVIVFAAKVGGPERSLRRWLRRHCHR